MREEYINARNSKSDLTQMLYTYAVSKGFTYDYNVFFQILFFVNYSDLVSKMDQIYGLTLLMDKNGNLIKVAE